MKLQFPTMLRKMWSGGEVQEWIDDQLNNQWISVEDELPPNKERVLLFDSDGFGVLSGRFSNSMWYLEGEKDTNANITHWMPLPKAPQK